MLYHERMIEHAMCRTPGHEDKPEHGRTGLCQACYRRARREELRDGAPKQKPGKKPDPTRPNSRYNPTSRHHRGGSTQCSNGHVWREGSYKVRSDDKKICLICVDDRKGELCPAGLHLRSEHENAYGQCRPCAARRQVAQRLRAKYGLTVEQFEARLIAQDNKCGICGDELDFEKHNGICMDHDHKCCPGEKTCGRCLREILCGDCNQGLGRFKDDVSILQSAIAYLDQYA